MPQPFLLFPEQHLEKARDYNRAYAADDGAEPADYAYYDNSADYYQKVVLGKTGMKHTVKVIGNGLSPAVPEGPAKQYVHAEGDCNAQDAA